ncbi:galactose-specific lectin nattectin-like [Siphateles boraxobius]|uniref:galactose-specific lectin nattectin-like n=1 Tax=Siphateles boraxobius TaxID=180520 RepID=UPI004062CD4C
MAVWTVYLSLCLLMALTASVEANPVQKRDCGVCQGGWSSFGCRCFKFFSNPQTWMDAEKTCSQLNGNLASVHSRAEHDFIHELVISKTEMMTTRTWIGGNDRVQEGDWVWSDGSKMNYQEWGFGEPNNSGGVEHCIDMNTKIIIRHILFHHGSWNDDACYKKKPFVCVN